MQGCEAVPGKVQCAPSTYTSEPASWGLVQGTTMKPRVKIKIVSRNLSVIQSEHSKLV